MSPETNKFVPLTESLEDYEENERVRELHRQTIAAQLDSAESKLLRPDGTPVPNHWPVFKVGELVTIKDYTFRVAYINEGTLLLEPVSAKDAMEILKNAKEILKNAKEILKNAKEDG